MYGAIAGDYVGSVINYGDQHSKLNYKHARLTGNSVMTAAVADAVRYYYDHDDGSIDMNLESDEESFRYRIAVALRKWYFRYPEAGYSKGLIEWINSIVVESDSGDAGPAVRVSPVAWLFRDIRTVRKAAKISASVTHNDPEVIKGAEAVASAVFLARTGHLKDEIRKIIKDEFKYDLDHTADTIEAEEGCVYSCDRIVREGILLFLDSRDSNYLVHTIRGFKHGNGDILSIAIALSDAYYGDSILRNVDFVLPDDMVEVFEKLGNRQAERVHEDEEQIHISEARVGMMSSFEKDIVRYYERINSKRKTAETFLLDVNSVEAVLHKAEKYLWRKYMYDSTVEEYVNELSHIKLNPDYYIDNGISLQEMDFGIRDIRFLESLHDECLYLVADILNSLCRKPTMLELTTMTGYSVEEVEKALCDIEKIKERSKDRKVKNLKDYL